MFYRILSKLLDYPDDTLASVLPEVRERTRAGHDFSQAERAVVLDFLEQMEAMPLTEWQAEYVRTFDLTPEHALHLTHHLFGDDKNRGPALIDLTEFYKGFGVDMAANDGDNNELPDYLPLVLEFAGLLQDDEAQMLLSQWTKVLKQLAANLDEAASPYAALVRLIEQRSQLVKAAA